jgi:hypothetical protein
MGRPAAAASSTPTPSPSAVAGWTTTSIAPQQPLHIGPKARAHYAIADPERPRLGADTPCHRPTSEAHDPRVRHGLEDRRHRAQQIAVSLALDQLRDDADDDGIPRQPERRAEQIVRDGMVEAAGIHGARDADHLAGIDARREQHAADLFGYRDHAIVEAVAPTQERAPRRMIDAARQHRAYAGQPRGERALHVGATAAVQVHDVRPLTADEPVQAPPEQRIEVAADRHRVHALAARTGLLRDRAAGRTREHALDVAAAQAFEQIEHLARAAVEVHPAFDVQHFHAVTMHRGSRAGTDPTTTRGLALIGSDR